MELVSTVSSLVRDSKNIPKHVLYSEDFLRLLAMTPHPDIPKLLGEIWEGHNIHLLYSNAILTVATALKDRLLSTSDQVSRPPEVPVHRETDSLALRLAYIANSPLVPLSNSFRWVSGVQRPLDLEGSASFYHENLILLQSEEVETLFQNSYRIFHALQIYGNAFQKIEDPAVLAVWLELFRKSTNARIRNYALFMLTSVCCMDVTHPCVIRELCMLLRQGCPKVGMDYSPQNTLVSFTRFIELLSWCLRSGFDINYPIPWSITFAEHYGQVAAETEEAVLLTETSYQGLTLLALATIYNRVDVINWLLQFTAPFPFDNGLEENGNMYQRNLELDCLAQDPVPEEEYKTIKCTMLHQKASTSLFPGTEIVRYYTVVDLADRHQSIGAKNTLVHYYEQMLAREEINPALQNV